MRRFLGILVALAPLLLVGSVKAAEPIRLRADAWCPYNCDPKADRPGYMIEIMRHVFADGGIDYQLLPWSRAVEEARAGRIEAVAGATAADGAGLVFGKQAIGLSTNVIVTRRGGPWRYTGLKSLDGKRLAAVKDYSYGEEMDKYIQAHATDSNRLELASGDDVTDQNLKKLLTGRVDAMVEDVNVVGFALAAQGIDNLVDIQPLNEGTPLFVAFAPGPKAAARAATLDEGIRSLRRSGELSHIMARYGLGDWQAP